MCLISIDLFYLGIVYYAKYNVSFDVCGWCGPFQIKDERIARCYRGLPSSCWNTILLLSKSFESNCGWWVCGGEYIKIGATHIEAVASVKVKSTNDSNVKVGNISRQHPASSQRPCLGGWGLSREGGGFRYIVCCK